jgi:peptidoglycan/LPS O-acetylase OafA/YrhL
MRTVISFVLSALLVAIFVFAADKAYSQASDREGYVTGITPARGRSLAGVALGLVSLTIGWRVKSRSSVGKSNRRSWAMIALMSGLVAVVLSIFHLYTVDGGFGTGGGKAGAIVALMLGIIGAGLNGVVLRSNVK